MSGRRCGFDGCKKKLGLTDMACRCESTFCGVHRHSEDHGCTFDYKKENEKQLLKTMSTVVAKKIDVI